MRTLASTGFAALIGLLVLASCSDEPTPTSADLNSRADTQIASKAIAECSPPWDAATAYSRGDHVSHNGDEWRAKKNSTGVEPGSHPAYWSDLGSCGGDPGPGPGPDPEPGDTMQIYGLWHAGNHYADWALPRTMSEFDEANHWIIDRGDGSPSVNLVVLSFLQPLEVLHMTTPEDGVPVGMTDSVVAYFKNADIRVMMSIGGITYVDYWNEALAEDATQLGLNAAYIADRFGVGIEIDYEENTNPDLFGLEDFIWAYRSEHRYDSTGMDPTARLTIDLAAGDRWLIALTQYATTHWLDNANPVLDYANAMVARKSGTPTNWQEHVDGKPQYDPPIPPLAPNKFTGGLYLSGNSANCDDFASSEQNAYADYVMSVQPNGAGSSSGMLGLMFWAAEYPSARKNYVGTVPPNTCEGGMGVAADSFNIQVPMPALRQQ